MNGSMVRQFIFWAGAMVFLSIAQVAHASNVGLADWCVNLNGDINTACNGAGSGGASGLGSISLASFDQTLESTGSNNLGTVTVNLGVGSNQTVAFYADFDLDVVAFGSFQDSGSVHNALPAGYSYELDNPNTSNIFGDFSGVPSPELPNTNLVGTASGPPNACCDVAFALAITGINVVAGDSATVSFTVSTTAPASGFYIQQINLDANDSIYLTSSVANPAVSGGGAAPEPSTLGLGALGLAMAVAGRRRVRGGGFFRVSR